MSHDENGFELVSVDSRIAMATPQDRYYDVDGISAYSCLIPLTDSMAKRVHFVSSSDGDEYGQYCSKSRAKDEAAAVVRRKSGQGL